MEDDTDHGTRPDTAVPPDSAPALSLDTVFEVLANQHRRFALYSLIDSAGAEMRLEALVEDVATLEAALANDALTRDRYLTIATDIYHWHVEVLAEVGLVEYDEQRETVRYQHQPRIETLVERIRPDELA